MKNLLTCLFKMLKSKRGQSVIEYAMLMVLVSTASFTAYELLNDPVEEKVRITARDLIQGVTGVPDSSAMTDEPEPDKKLSPPVAKVHIPSPNYKGRDVVVPSASYDTDGVVEEHRWVVYDQDGNVILEESSSKSSIGDLGGETLRIDGPTLLRHPGTYKIKLTVIDNDGLISMPFEGDLLVVNRAPTISVTGLPTEICVGEFATYKTEYYDDDLPYEEHLSFDSTLTSKYHNSSEEVIHTNSYTTETVPEDYTRQFKNAGTYTYSVKITDENNATATDSATITVKEGGDCTPDILPPTCSLAITGTNGFTPTYDATEDVYYFDPDTQAKITVSADYKNGDPHPSSPHFWQGTETVASGIWKNDPEIFRPYNSMFTAEHAVNGTVFTITSKVRNSDMVEAECGTVKMKVRYLGGNAPTPIITVNGANPSTVAEVYNHNVAGSPDKSALLKIESYTSDPGVPAGYIKGSRWKLNGDPYIPSTAVFNSSNITDLDGDSFEWCNSTTDAPNHDGTGAWCPDSPNEQKFVLGQGPYQTNVPGDTWIFKLHVISNKDEKSTAPATKKIVLTLKDDPPELWCEDEKGTKGEIRLLEGETLQNKLTIKGKDPENNSVYAKISQNGTDWTAEKPVPFNAPSGWVWNTAGEYEIKIVGHDGNAANEVNATCKVIVGTDSASLDLEFWDFDYRAGKQGSPFPVSNRTTDINDVYHTYFTQGGMSTGCTSGCTSETSNKITGVHSSVNHNQQITMDDDSFVGAGWVTLNTTDKNGYDNTSKPSCTPSTGAKDYRCTKGATYFRMGTLEWNENSEGDIVPGGGTSRCRYSTIKQGYKTPQTAAGSAIWGIWKDENICRFVGSTCHKYWLSKQAKANTFGTCSSTGGGGGGGGVGGCSVRGEGISAQGVVCG